MHNGALRDIKRYTLPHKESAESWIKKARFTTELRKIILFFFRTLFMVPEIFTLCTIFDRMLGIEPELLPPQPGVLPMSYTHPYERYTSLFCVWHCPFKGLCRCFRNRVSIPRGDWLAKVLNSVESDSPGVLYPKEINSPGYVNKLSKILMKREKQFAYWSDGVWKNWR